MAPEGKEYKWGIFKIKTSKTRYNEGDRNR